MERLQFGADERYVAIEAAVHLARYSMARPVSAHRRVLDIACGEGYGSYAMATRWGAKHVTALDISPEAVASAKRNFSAENISFDIGSAYDLSERFSANSFDLIVSLETIEHLEEPELFLHQIPKVASPNAVIIISCPNDAVHYEEGSAGNPYHMRRYTSREFFTMAESILGPCRRKFVGTSISGFGNFAVDSNRLTIGADAAAVVSGPLNPALPELYVPPDDKLDLDTASYYVGVWGGTEAYPEDENIVFYPCNTNSAAQAALSAEIGNLRTKIWELEHSAPRAKFRAEVLSMQEQLRQKDLRIRAVTAENAAAREVIGALKARIESSNAKGNRFSSFTRSEDEPASLASQVRQQGLRIQVLTAENELARSSIRALTAKLATNQNAGAWRTVELYRSLNRRISHLASQIFARLFKNTGAK